MSKVIGPFILADSWEVSRERGTLSNSHEVPVSADRRAGLSMWWNSMAIIKSKEEKHYILGQIFFTLFLTFNIMACIFS